MLLDKNNLYVGMPYDCNERVILKESTSGLLHSASNGMFLGSRDALLGANVDPDLISTFVEFVQAQSAGNEGERVILLNPREVVIDIWSDGLEIINYDSLRTESLNDVFEAGTDWEKSFESYVMKKFKELVIAAL